MVLASCANEILPGNAIVCGNGPAPLCNQGVCVHRKKNGGHKKKCLKAGCSHSRELAHLSEDGNNCQNYQSRGY